MYFSAELISDFTSYAAAEGADLAALKKAFPLSKKQKHVSYTAVEDLLNHLERELNCDTLGLRIGEQIALKTTAYVDSIMQHSETLESAFKNAVYYSKLISDALDCSLIKNKINYSVVFEENPNWKVHQKQARRHILDLTLLSCLNSLVIYTGKSYYPSKVSFNSERPKNLNEYYRLFNCSLKFNHHQNEIVFEKQIFDKHAKKIEFGLLENLKEKVKEEIQSLETENQLIYNLKKTILDFKPKRILIEVASTKLNLSKRTLQRKLHELGTTFKAVEYELQLKLSKTYLEEKQKPIDEISYLLGFSESSAFIRFFRSLTNMTPSEYQNRLTKK